MDKHPLHQTFYSLTKHIVTVFMLVVHQLVDLATYLHPLGTVSSLLSQHYHRPGRLGSCPMVPYFRLPRNNLPSNHLLTILHPISSMKNNALNFYAS